MHIVKTFGIALLFFVVTPLSAQELISNEFEKGYVKDGEKYLVWDYFNEQKELELKINHTTGKLYFIKEDTTAFVIQKDGEWVEEKLKVYAIPLEGYALFRQSIKQQLCYPAAARRSGIDGEVLVMFEVDSTGIPSNLSIVKDIGGDCGREVARVLSQIKTRWIPAQADQKIYSSRFVLPVIFGLGERPRIKPFRKLPLARRLNEIELIAMGTGR